MPPTRILIFMATGSPVGGVATWLDNAFSYLANRGYDPIVGLVQGLETHNPDRFQQFHPNLNSVIVDGRGLNSEGRIRACLRLIDKTRPKLLLPLGVLDANIAALRAKVTGHQLHLVARAQGNLPEMLADLEEYRDGIDHVVCVGALTRSYLVSHAGFSSDQVSHIPNGSAPVTRQHVPRIPNSPLRLGYVGRLSPSDKRVNDIPNLCEELVRRNIPFNLRVVGSGPYEEVLRTRLKTFKEHVVMEGSKTGSEVYSEVFPNLDILLLFSESESFGIVLAEAMMNGVVPVTSRYIGFESEGLVIDGKHGLSFPIGNMKSAADAIASLSTDPNRLEQLARNASVHAHTNYSWSRCLSQWDIQLQNILSRPSHSVPEHLLNAPRTSSGRLDRLGIPMGITDTIRRIRRNLLGVPVERGGEEWPLFKHTHSTSRLNQIHQNCLELEKKMRRNNVV